tara:strand:- start:929 stop:1123 length:195 start_codon:yes stop_codon:yes gene_type:complete
VLGHEEYSEQHQQITHTFIPNVLERINIQKKEGYSISVEKMKKSIFFCNFTPLTRTKVSNEEII